ncbi:MAG: H(+)-transporting ATPase [Clostridia bacterium]|nr:H(+)-transporting ATPase [Clostridia bacterium]
MKNRSLSPGRLIALGFLALILLGALLLWLPVSHNAGQTVSFVDALFLSTSATCVTGLSPLVVSETFNTFGKGVFVFLIQIGGLGVACIGASFVLLLRRKMGIKDQSLVREGWNVSGSAAVKKLLTFALFLTVSIEALGAILSTLIFAQDMPFFDALGTGIFHSVSAFNNAGFDVLGPESLIPYQGNVALTLLTSVLIIAGGLGFIVYRDLFEKRRLSKCTLHTKIVLSMTAVLLVGGTLLLWLIGDTDLLNSFFFSVSARTAGFMTVPVGSLSHASLFLLVILMFIGASPGSTGGGIKTTTAFAAYLTVKSLVTGKKRQVFRRKLPDDTVHKALTLVFLALFVVCAAVFVLSILEPTIEFLDLLVETVSAAATVGLSTGITPVLSDASKLVLTLVMYIGRLGPLTAATIWTIKQESALSYSSESITIG